MTLNAFLPADITALQFGMMGALIFLGACLQGVGGIGFSMLSAPVAVLFFPQLAPGPLLAMGGLVSLLGAVREFRSIAWRATGNALAGRAAGTLVAVAAMTQLPARLLALIFALSILAAVTLSLLGWRVRASGLNMAVAGAASGFMGTVTSAGAPPFAIVMQHLPPPQLRATIGCILCAGAAFSLAMLWAAGRFGLADLWLSASLTPMLLLGFAISNRLKNRFSAKTVRKLLLALCTAGAVGVLVKLALPA
ncbi:sulfite exporter TauE/SafE family protein [Cupriavidus sp. 2TAF22]|uniref:sulfite exporter TauE/SafE family protein n=1 Tax=unclassified Cupriavidus TaxID=2640874 RepID=UPI003F914548